MQATRELEARTKEWHSLENGYHSQLSEKDAEIRHLLLQVDLASQSNVEEVANTRQMIEESMRELEAHKAKRLAARNEMITLAKVGVGLTGIVFVSLSSRILYLLHRAWRKPRPMGKRSRRNCSSSSPRWFRNRSVCC